MEKRAIEGFSGYYVSVEGIIYKENGEEVAIRANRKYRQCHLRNDNGEFKTRKVHRLVAKAFPEICGEWFEGCVVDHINGIQTDNRAVNLRVCTQADNMFFYYGFRKEKKFTLHIPKSPVAQYTKQGEFIKWYPSSRKASKETGVSRSSISECITNPKKRHSAGGFRWVRG